MPSLEYVLRKTSRTFAIGIEGLPRPLREEMRIAYLILRVSDYLEDNTTLAPSEKAELLDSWAKTLEGTSLDQRLLSHLQATEDPSPDALAAHHASEIIQGLGQISKGAQEVIRSHTLDSTRGMARWVRRGPDIRTEADLDDYMHEVAGRVGHLITGLFSLFSSRVKAQVGEMMVLAREFGLALQTVNIVRGIPGDIDRGWFFVPREFLPDPIDTGAQFLDPMNREQAVAVVDRLLGKASRHFEAAEEYITRLPRIRGKLRYFCLLPYFFGLRTLALSGGNAQVLVSEVKLTRGEVRSIAVRTRIWGWSDTWIRRFGASVAKGPGGNG